MQTKRNITAFNLSRRWTFSLTILIALIGVILILTANLIPEEPRVWPVGFTTLGIALLISGTISLIQRQFTAEFLYDQVLAELEIALHEALRSRFDLIDSSSMIGIRNIFPEWSAFLEHELPKRLEFVRDNVKVVGSALTGFSVAIVGGGLNQIVVKKFREETKFTLCTVQPGSPAALYREHELGHKGSATTAATSSLYYLSNLSGQHPEASIDIRSLSTIVPKATILCLDDEILFFSPYTSRRPTASSLVIETHKGDSLFEDLKSDLDYLLGLSTPWESREDDGVSLNN